MKQIHNVRVRIISSDKQQIQEIFSKIRSDAELKLEEGQQSFRRDEEDAQPLWLGELWLDHQRPVRKFFSLLLKALSSENKRQLHNNPSKFIDTATHCFLRLDKQALLAGNYCLTENNDSAHVRLNIAAFPATKENAMRLLQEMMRGE